MFLDDGWRSWKFETIPRVLHFKKWWQKNPTEILIWIIFMFWMWIKKDAINEKKRDVCWCISSYENNIQQYHISKSSDHTNNQIHKSHGKIWSNGHTWKMAKPFLELVRRWFPTLACQKYHQDQATDISNAEGCVKSHGSRHFQENLSFFGGRKSKGLHNLGQFCHESIRDANRMASPLSMKFIQKGWVV